MMLTIAVVIVISGSLMVGLPLAVAYWLREPGERVLPGVSVELHRIRRGFERSDLRRQVRTDAERLRRELRDEASAIRARRYEEL